MKKRTVLNKITNNKRYQDINEVYKILVEKYGSVTIAGGSLADCYFDKDFYDIDCFISLKDLKEEWHKDINKDSNTNILGVLKDKINGLEVDVVVVDCSVKKHINRFDQHFKQIWLNKKGLQISYNAVKNLSSNKISISVINGPVVYFRIVKSAEKYNMELDVNDVWLLRNYLTGFSSLRLPDKYENMKNVFSPVNNFDYLLGETLYKYTKCYWNKKLIYMPSWSIVKLLMMPYLIRKKLLIKK